MSIIEMYGFPVCLFTAIFCLALGAYLTAHRRKAQNFHVVLAKTRRPSWREIQALSFPSESPLPGYKTSIFCPACGKQEEVPNARYCWFCGNDFKEPSSLLHRFRMTGQHLVNTTGL